MQLISPKWVDALGRVNAGISTRDISWPSAATMDNSQIGFENRKQLLQDLGLETRALFTPSQQHGNTVVNADSQPPGSDGDAVIARDSGAVIAVGVADCPAILLCDPTTGARAAIHSGWRGTTKNIVGKTIATLRDAYGVKTENIWAWISPAAQQNSYEVESDVADLFADKYLTKKDTTKFLLSVPHAVHDQLLESGVSPQQIERDQKDTISDNSFHSYRRGGEDYGLMLALIG